MKLEDYSLHHHHNHVIYAKERYTMWTALALYVGNKQVEDTAYYVVRHHY
jgi:hypothetical protein